MNTSFKWSSTNKTKETERNSRCFNLAFLYFKNNDLDAAEKCARDSIATDDTDRGHKLLGDILLSKKKRDEALLEYQRSIELNPNQEEAYFKVCDLLSGSDNCDVDSMRYWCERAERAGFIEVVERFQKAIESGVAFPGRSHMNHLLTRVSMHDTSGTNGSGVDVLDTSSRSMERSRHNLSLNDTGPGASPSSRVIPSASERAILTKVNSQEILLKNILAQQEKLLDSHRLLMQEVIANRGSIDNLKKDLTGLKSSVSEVKSFAGVLGTMSSKLNDISEAQREIKDVVYDIQVSSYREEEDEDTEYQDTVYGNENQRPGPVYEPISPALNVQGLPNFEHMNISGFSQQQNNVNKTASQGGSSSVFSRLGDKATSTPIQTSAPVSFTAPKLTGSAGSASAFTPSSFNFGKVDGAKTSSPTVAPAAPQAAPVKPAAVKPISAPKVTSKPAKEVEIVLEKPAPLPAANLVAKAESMQLPKTFYNYMDKPDCTGCRGCEEEGTVTVTSTVASISSTTATTVANVSPKTTSVFEGIGPSKFGSPNSASDSSTKLDSTIKSAAAPTAPAPTTSLFGKPAASASGDKAAFSFGFQSNNASIPSASIFGSSAAPLTEQPKGNLFNVPPFGSAPGSTEPIKFSFGIGAGASAGSTSGSTGLFSAALKEAGADCAGSGFKWGGASDKPAWQVSSPSQIFGQKICNANEGEEDDEENPEEDSVDDNLFLLPTVELPDQIEIKTGEEDEDIIYCQRAKLYRYDQPTKQWKERGIGDLKILKNRSVENKYRIVLRREQVHKIACNHYLTPQLKFAPMNNSETSVCWFARDYADEEFADEQFAIKFKNKDILKVFTDKVEELQKSMAPSSE